MGRPITKPRPQIRFVFCTLGFWKPVNRVHNKIVCEFNNNSPYIQPFDVAKVAGAMQRREYKVVFINPHV